MLGILVVILVSTFVDFGILPSGLPKGQTAFLYLATVFMAPCLLAGLHWTADCLAEEIREGTLGLLFLTPLRGRDILIGKLGSSSLGAAYCLAGLVPLFSLILLFGGVVVGDVLRASLALANAMFFSLAVGL